MNGGRMAVFQFSLKSGGFTGDVDHLLVAGGWRQDFYYAAESPGIWIQDGDARIHDICWGPVDCLRGDASAVDGQRKAGSSRTAG